MKTITLAILLLLAGCSTPKSQPGDTETIERPTPGIEYEYE